MQDWDTFLLAVPWFHDAEAKVHVSHNSEQFALSNDAAKLFPKLNQLLSLATVTRVSVNNTDYLLFAWDNHDGERVGWLCLTLSKDPPLELYSEHRVLLSSFGGIVERSNEPEDTWLLNHNDVLTQKEASHDGGSVREFQWAFDEDGLTLPIDPTEYYSIAREANGNTTLCHRTSGQVLLFAPDHAFDHIAVLEGCPEYTLYRIGGADHFRDWIETIARQWLNTVAK